VLDIRQILRAGPDDELLKEKLLMALNSRAKDGVEAEQRRKNHTPVSESMSTIGG
jgi:cyclic pyranopterin phosphate synthase